MAESPPPSNPNPNPNPSPNPSPKSPPPSQTLETPNPQILPNNPSEDDPESDPSIMSSPNPNKTLESNPPTPSSRRPTKRKKGFHKKSQPFAKKSQLALEKKLQTLSQVFHPIPFVPSKRLDFDRFEVELRQLGLWDFAHLEFDTHLRADLIAQLVVQYVPKQRQFYVNGFRVGVNRADLGRALKLPGKRGELEGVVFGGEFLGFLEEFVSNWMLLHEEMWIVPAEIVGMMGLIKEGQFEKVDWAGLVWYMVEKELAQGAALRDCYYAAHLQRLIKVQREELLLKGKEETQVDLTVDDDDEGGDVAMLEDGGIRDGQDEVVTVAIAGEKADSVGETEKVDEGGDGDKMEKEVEEGEKVENEGEKSDVGVGEEGREGENPGDVGDSEEVNNVENRGEVENVGDVNNVENEDKVCDEDMSVDKVCREENVGDVNNVGTEIEVVGKVENVEKTDDHVGDVEKADEHVGDDGKADEQVGNVDKADEEVDNVDNADEQVDNVDNADEHMENVDEHVDVLDNNIENVEEEEEEEGKDGDMMDFGYCKGDEQERWLLDGKAESSDQPFLQRCSMTDSQLGAIKHEIVEEDEEHVEGFQITSQKTPLDGFPQANLMQAFETGPLQYPPADHGGQPSLQLMFNHGGKRELDHEDDIALHHHPLNDTRHKKMRLDGSGSWGHPKPPSDFDICMDQIQHLLNKARMAREAEKVEAYEQGNMSMNMAHEMVRKDNEIMQLKCRFDELDRTRLAEINRLNRELYLMNSVINGYRSALKDTQRAFSEFRKRCGVPDEPVYKDAGSGGIVKSVAELERERIRQEQERKLLEQERKSICSFIEETYGEQMKHYDSEWESILIKVQSLDARIQTAEDTVGLLKKHRMKRVASESVASENTRNESQDSPQQKVED